MQNLTKKQLNIILLTLCGITALIVLICGITLHDNGRAYLSEGDYYDFADSWVLVGGEGSDIGFMPITLPYNVDAPAGETITITHKVPDNVDENTVLFFRTEYQAVEVKIDNTVVYSYGVDEKRPFGKSSVPVYNMADVSDVYAGGNISITFLSGYKFYSGQIPEVFYGNKGQVMYTIWKENAATFILSSLLIIFSLVAVIIYLFMGKHRKEHPVFGYLVIFMSVVSVWSICDNKIIQLVISNIYAIWLIKALLLQIIPVAYLIYVRCFTDKRKVIRLIDYGIWAYLTSFVAATVFQLMGLCDYVQYMTLAKILIFIGLVLITIVLSTAIITFGKKSLRDNVIANIVFIIIGAISFVLGLFSSTKTASNILVRIGIFIYVLCLLVVTERHVLMKADKKKENEEELIRSQRQLALDSLNPNFIFAAMKLTLGFIKKQSDTSGAVLINLSQYIRYKFSALDNEDEIVDFDRELEYIKSYLYVEKLRHEKLVVSIEDKITEFKVPINTIEPLVENAIKYGLSRRDYEGTLAIRSYERKDSYAIQVIDNGIGFDVNNIKKNTFTSILALTKKIESLEGDIDIVSKKGKGTIITIRFPKVNVE